MDYKKILMSCAVLFIAFNVGIMAGIFDQRKRTNVQAQEDISFWNDVMEAMIVNHYRPVVCPKDNEKMVHITHVYVGRNGIETCAIDAEDTYDGR